MGGRVPKARHACGVPAVRTREQDVSSASPVSGRSCSGAACRLKGTIFGFPYFCTMRVSTVESGTCMSPRVSDNFHIFLRRSTWEMTSREGRPRILRSVFRPKSKICGFVWEITSG